MVSTNAVSYTHLADFGYDVVQVQSRLGGGYYLGSREFELPELKLLVDAVPVSYTHLDVYKRQGCM